MFLPSPHDGSQCHCYTENNTGWHLLLAFILSWMLEQNLEGGEVRGTVVKFFPVFRSFLEAQLVKNLLQYRKPWLDSWVRKSPGEGIDYPLQYSWASLVAQLVKNLQCRRHGFDSSPLEKETVTHSGILAWRIPWAL